MMEAFLMVAVVVSALIVNLGIGVIAILGLLNLLSRFFPK